MQFKAPELAILFTLAYTDQFDFPLTETELWHRLILLDGHNFSRPEFKKALLKLALHKDISYVHFYICLAGREAITEKRKHRAVVAAQKKNDIAHFNQVIKYIPFVQAAFITGSVAMGNADVDDDLDLLLVTKTRRLWLARLVLLGVTWAMGKKKARSTEGKHGWCLNLWLDEDHLAVEEKKRDLYQAYEVLQALPIHGTQEVITRFYSENAWTRMYLPHFEKTYKMKSLKAQVQKETSLSSSFLDWLETVAFSLQLSYMSSHRTTEKVGKGFAFFHPRPTGTLVKAGWLNSLQRKNLKELVTITSKYADKLFAQSLQNTSRAR